MENEDVFVRVTNAQIYTKLLDIEKTQQMQGSALVALSKDNAALEKENQSIGKRVRAVELKVYGVFAGLAPGLGMLVALLAKGGA